MTSRSAVATDGGTALNVRGLGLRIEGSHILDDVSLDVSCGEFIGIIGPNGAGKTSLLNCISGTMRPTAGSVTFAGEDMTTLPVHVKAQRGLARTFQTSTLFPGLSVQENVRLMVQARSVKGPSWWWPIRTNDPTLDEALGALQRVGLAHRRHAMSGDLSHGELRKLELAIVLVAQAKLVLLDEPMAGVNTEDIGELIELIRDLRVETGATFLMVEHHMDVVLDLVDRIAVMHHGRMLTIGTSADVMANEEVRTAYIGESL